MNIKKPKTVVAQIISSHDYFPGNPYYPLVIYRQVFSAQKEKPETIQNWLQHNEWKHAWVDSIYDFHHYHSKSHEVLVIISGECQVQFGGENGVVYTVTPGDVVILPAGVAHKSLSMNAEFRCIGACSCEKGYDMNCGKPSEYTEAITQIKHVGLPAKDPIFGEKGLLFEYWHDSLNT